MNKTGLPEDVAQVLDRANEVKEEVPADVRARMLQRLQASVAAGVTAPMPPPPSSSWVSAGVWVTLGVTCVLLVGSAAWWMNRATPPEQTVPQPAAPSLAVAPQAPPPTVANAHEAPLNAEEPVATPPARPARAPGKPVARPAAAAVAPPGEAPPTTPVVEQAPPTDEEDSLFAERALLDAARSGLGAGHTADARASLAEHARVHPNGKLLEERRALEVLVLAREGKTQEAQAAAAAFSRSWPKSVFLPSIQRAVPP